MNATDFSFLLNRPGAVRDRHLASLDKIIEQFPFFQSARALQLKSLYNQDSFRYNEALKVTAAHTCDRGVLFDFITSGQFTGIQQVFSEHKQAVVNEILVSGMEIVSATNHDELRPAMPNTIETSIRSLIKDSVSTVSETSTEVPDAEEKERALDRLELGKPLGFAKNETHSFQEWLQLASFKPIERTEQPVSQNSIERLKKLDIIDRFIENNPKISPVKATEQSSAPKHVANEDTSYLMTETLAKVYLEQKKYQKAIQAYEILILKYPEKSSLFADRISDIKVIQQNNN